MKEMPADVGDAEYLLLYDSLPWARLVRYVTVIVGTKFQQDIQQLFPSTYVCNVQVYVNVCT